MRAIAEYAMRGRTQATAVAAISVAIPFCFWISAATIGLVTLRRGWGEGLSLLLWATLPAAVWVVLRSDPTALLVLAVTLVLALVLRATTSWVATLMTGFGLGVALALLMPLLMPEFMGQLVTEVMRVSERQAPEILAQLAQDSSVPLEVWLRALFAGGLATVVLLAAVGSLMLGRWWQASLFNPGGFRQEFHALRLPPGVAALLVFLVFAGPALAPALLGILPLVSVPLLIAALALVHGIAGLKGWATHWLVAFYLLLFFVGPYLYFLLVLMAVLDSLLDFRKRLRPAG